MDESFLAKLSERIEIYKRERDAREGTDEFPYYNGAWSAMNVVYYWITGNPDATGTLGNLVNKERSR